MANYWFKRKRYGWGLRPATWQGWTSLAIFVALVILNTMRLDAGSRSAGDTLRPFVIQTVALALIFIVVAFWKGERPLRWQWGRKEGETR